MRILRTASLLLALLGPVGCAGNASVETSKTVAAKPENAWMNEEAMRAWQDEHRTEGVWAVAYFLPAEWECYKTRRGDLVPRWKVLSKGDVSLSREELARNALAALEGAAPDGLSNPLGRVRLRLLDAGIAGKTLRVNFSPGIYATNSMGTCGASAMALQFVATVHHYFPEADEACVLVNETPSGRDGEALVFHDSVGCPMTLADFG